MRADRRVVLLCISLLPAADRVAEAQAGASVVATLHNLSVSGPGEIRAATEKEVCKFCHVPHTAVDPSPLWGHRLSDTASYAVPDVRESGKVVRPAPQPDGSSRLCLSCHDGTVALGDMGRNGVVAMKGSQRLLPGRPGFLGTDLSGSHPISITMPATDPGADDGGDVGLLPREAMAADHEVKLDKDGKIQCTTCHDPHSDRYFVPGRVPHFWVKSTVEDVCLACHQLR
jgi:hypothetical protein